MQTPREKFFDWLRYHRYDADVAIVIADKAAEFFAEPGQPSGLESLVRHLIDNNAVHRRKGTVLGKEDWGTVIKHLTDEVRELDVGILEFHGGHCTRDHLLQELGDILGIVVHATIKAGFTMAEVERREIAKLGERFECAAPPPQPAAVGESAMPCSFPEAYAAWWQRSQPMSMHPLLDALSKQRDAISSHGYATGRINNATAARMEAELVRIAVKLADEWKRSKYAEQPQAGDLDEYNPDYLACLTGDCPHDNANVCVVSLKADANKMFAALRQERHQSEVYRKRMAEVEADNARLTTAAERLASLASLSGDPVEAFAKWSEEREKQTTWRPSPEERADANFFWSSGWKWASDRMSAHVATEQEMHAAWRKRAEESEQELTEVCRLTTALREAEERAERLQRGIAAIQALMAESTGVAGLHKNGNVAPWDELRAGGRFEEWLFDFDTALQPAASEAEAESAARAAAIEFAKGEG